MWLFEVSRGIDYSEGKKVMSMKEIMNLTYDPSCGSVTPKTLTKSMLSSKNFRPSITTWEEAVRRHSLAKLVL